MEGRLDERHRGREVDGAVRTHASATEDGVKSSLRRRAAASARRRSRRGVIDATSRR